MFLGSCTHVICRGNATVQCTISRLFYDLVYISLESDCLTGSGPYSLDNSVIDPQFVRHIAILGDKASAVVVDLVKFDKIKRSRN